MPYIKNKLFEIANKFNDFTFQQNLKIGFNKKEQFFNKIWLQINGFIHTEVFDDITIDKLLDKHHNHLSVRIENWIHEGLAWFYLSLLRHEPFISGISAFKETSYLPLPKKLNSSMKVLINVQCIE